MKCIHRNEGEMAPEMFHGEHALTHVLRNASIEWAHNDDDNSIENPRLGHFQHQARKALEHMNGDRR